MAATTVIALAVSIRVRRDMKGSKAARPVAHRCSGVRRHRGCECQLGEVPPCLPVPHLRPGVVRRSTLAQAALAANSDRLDGIQFVTTTVFTYFRPDGIRFVPYLPF